MSVLLCVPFDFGTVVRITGSFRRPPTQDEIDDGTAADADDWQPIDPDTVAAKTKDPAGNIDQYDYLGSPTGELVRDDVGEYHLDLTPASSGTWTFGFIATGNGAAASSGTFKVNDDPFAP